MADAKPPSWDSLLEEYKNCPCGHSTFSVATRMAEYYPEQTQKLLPQLSGNGLTYDGKAEGDGTTWEWAAALTAAKIAVLQKDNRGKIEGVLGNTSRLANVSPDEIHGNAFKRYQHEKKLNGKPGVKGCDGLGF